MFKKKGEEDVREVSKDGGQEDIQDRSKSVPEGSSDKSENKEVEKKECSPEDKAKKEQIFTELVDAIKELTNLLRTQNQGPSLMDTLLGNNVSSGLESLPKGSDMKASLSRTPGIENIIPEQTPESTATITKDVTIIPNDQVSQESSGELGSLIDELNNKQR